VDPHSLTKRGKVKKNNRKVPTAAVHVMEKVGRPIKKQHIGRSHTIKQLSPSETRRGLSCRAVEQPGLKGKKEDRKGTVALHKTVCSQGE